MRDYGKVHTTFWTSKTIGTLSEDGRTLAIYLITCGHSNIAGAFRLSDGYAVDDLGWPSERVSKGFAELFDKGFANRCEVTKWVWVYKHLKWNPPENPNQKKAVAKCAAQIPDDCTWRARFYEAFEEIIGPDPLKSANPSQTVPQPFLNQKQEQEQEQKQEQEQEQSKPILVPGKPVTPPEGSQTSSIADLESKRQAKERRLTEITQDAFDSYNLAPFTKRHGGNCPNLQLLTEERRKNVKRCLDVAKAITCKLTGSTVITRAFWDSYWETVNGDDFCSGRTPGGAGHTNWKPDFEYLTRPDVMTKLFDKAMSEADAQGKAHG